MATEVTLLTRAIAKQSVLNVKKFGALGNGVKDDTAAINAAIKACYEAGGGTVEVPQGRYMIDAAQQVDMMDYIHFKMDPMAELMVRPNSLERYGLINMKSVNDAIISGGILIGDRDKHTYAGSGTHEWGHGIQLYGVQRVSIIGTKMTGFTGDGMSIGRNGTLRSNDVQIIEVLSTRNRRQGLSIVTGDNVLVYRSEFSYTGDEMPGEAAGTPPMCGIDIEPEKAAGAIRNIQIIQTRMAYNKRFGFLLERRSDENGGADVYDVLVAECTIEQNFSNGFQNKAGTNLILRDSTIQDNSASGTVWTGDKGSKVFNNTFRRNYTRNGVKVQNPPFTLTGTNSKTARDILKQAGTNVEVGSNRFE